MVSYEINYSPYFERLKLQGEMGDPVKHCRFPPSQNTHFTYICLKSEICCENGCCVTSLRRMAQFWYFWLILIVVCIAFLGCMHYYKKLKEERENRFYESGNWRRRTMNRRLARCRVGTFGRAHERFELCEHSSDSRQESRRSSTPDRSPETFAERGDDGEINQLFLEHLIVSYQNRNNMLLSNLGSTQPPDYNTIYNEPPPKYSVACQMLNENKKAKTEVIIEESTNNETSAEIETSSNLPDNNHQEDENNCNN